MKKIFITLIIFCLVGCSNNISKDTVLTYDDAVKLIDKGSVIVDVRTEAEYNERHIENALLIPLDTISKEVLEEKIPDKEAYIIVYCRSGSRSKKAQEELNNLGYTNVYNLGSIDNFKE